MNRIKQLRKEKKLSQLELAQKLGVAQSTLSTWETGRFEPDSKSLIALSEIFSVSVDYILGREKSFFQKTKDILQDNSGQHLVGWFLPTKENKADADNGANLVKKCINLFSKLSEQEQLIIVAQMEGILNSKTTTSTIAARSGEYQEKEISAETAAELEKIINEV